MSNPTNPPIVHITGGPTVDSKIRIALSPGPKGDPGEGLITNNEQVVSGIENVTTFDSFYENEFRMVKYLVSISKTDGGDNKFYSTELSLLIDGNDISLNEFGTLDNDGDIGTISVSRSGGMINFIITPNPAITPVTVRFARIGLKA